MAVTDRLASAMVSSNLAWDRNNIRDVDYIAALGMAGVNNRTASVLYRMLHVGDAGSVRDARIELMKLIRRQALRQGWPIKHADQYRSLANEVLTFAINPRCPHCHGQRFQKRPGTPYLSSTPCQACKGSGLRQTKNRFVRMVMAELDFAESWMNHHVNRRMSSLRHQGV
jgi:hypothetical protein